MQIDPGDQPIHTRALSVELEQGESGLVVARAYLLDLRKRGFCPVGSELQGMGIIHHMQLQATIDSAARTFIKLAAAQPTIAFEASAATLGESCRDPLARVEALAGVALGEGFQTALRAAIGGALGCAHVFVLAQFLAATVDWALCWGREIDRDGSDRHLGEKLFRRDLVFDGFERHGGGMRVAILLGDLQFSPAPSLSLPADRFGHHLELRMSIDLDGWPATVVAIRGGRRLRGRADFAHSSWEDIAPSVAGLLGVNLGQGASGQFLRQLKESPPLRDAFLMLLPALIQCRASFPDKWLNVATATPGHPGLISPADSCYMWRRDGALDRVRADLSKPKIS